MTEAVSIQPDLMTVLLCSGLELRKWSFNTREVLLDISLENRIQKSSSFSDNDGSNIKVFWIYWHPSDDVLRCKLHLDSKPVYSKCGILSFTARFFDPLGLFAPTIFLAKHIMQHTWFAACSWDSPLPSDIMQK